MFEFLSHYFWLLAIGIGLFNYFHLRKTVKVYIEEDPSREPGYEQFLNFFLVFTLLPWMFVGAGILSGKAANVFDFLHPKGGSWVVEIFWGFAVSIFFISSAWIILGSGAEFFEHHPGLLRINVPGVDPVRPTARQIRIVWIVAVIIAALVFSFFFLSPGNAPNGMELPPGPSR